MTSGFEQFGPLTRESFRLWQETADAFARQWLSSPFYLAATAAQSRLIIASVESYLNYWTANGFDRDALRTSLRKSLGLYASGTEIALANVKIAQTAGLLPATAPTPFEVIAETLHYRLVRYESGTRTRKTPVLMVSSLVGKHYILDLTPGRSYVSHLLDEGFDVFLIQWTTTDSAENVGLADYADNFLRDIAETIRRTTHEEKISLLGYSMGGIMALVFAALYPKGIANLLLLATPVDFDPSHVIGKWTAAENFDVEKMTELFGNISAETISLGFQMIKPVSSAMRGFNILQYSESAEDFNALTALEIWLLDAAPLPAALFRDLIGKLYRQNQLINGKLKLNGRRVELSGVSCPILNVTASHDQVASPDTSARLFERIGSTDKESVNFDYGHLTIVAGRGAKEEFWQKSAGWLAARS